MHGLVNLGHDTDHCFARDRPITSRSMSRFHEAIARAIRSARESRSMSQQELARRLGVSRATIANLENERQSISLDFFIQLSTVVDIHPCDLLTSDIVEAARADIPAAVTDDLPEDDRARVQAALSDLLG